MSTKEQRVLFLFGHLHKGGMQRAVSNISKALGSQYVQFVGFYGTENPEFEYAATLHDFGISGSYRIGLFGKVANFIRRVAALRRFVKQQKIDLVISFGETANVVNLACTHSARKIVSVRVALEESLRATGQYAALYKWLLKKLYPRAETVVAVSEALALQLRQRLPKTANVTAIPNLYHIDAIRALAIEPLPDSFMRVTNRRFILNVGSYCYQKGQDLLIEAFALAKTQLPDIALVLMGCGEWKPMLEDLVRDRNLQDSVVFLDFDANPYRIMAHAEALVLSSRFEGFPNVLVEAMVCGTPVISFDCDTGPREIIGASNYGLLIDNLSVAQLSKSLVYMLTDEEIRIRYKNLSMNRALSFSADAVIGRWEHLITRRFQDRSATS